MTGIDSLEYLLSLFQSQGVRTAYVKHLAKRQDNSKNQIYLGGALEGVANLFPATIHARSASKSKAKRKSKSGKPKLEAHLDFAWLSQNGDRDDAVHTCIIDYFQYPEIRLSGFLRGSSRSPRSLRREEQAHYGQRILIMGTAADGKVVGVVLTERNDPLVVDFPELPLLDDSGVLHVLAVEGEIGVAPSELLRQEISAIIRGGWHKGRIRRKNGVEPFRGAQGGGYTLEALLGVVANGDKAPDRHGFEIKSFSSSRISLMTPTPDFGFQGEHSFREFMHAYGRSGSRGDGSLRFTGVHRCGEVCKSTGFGMRVSGYDRGSDSFGDVIEVGVEIFDPATGDIVAGWSLEKLANCWNAKHANALYIKCKKKATNDIPLWRYANDWLTGMGTDVWRLLRAIDGGLVFYDPADTIYADGGTKVRSQWRINVRDLPEAMERLYARSETVTL